MSDREPLTPELKSVEAALASLVPLPPSTADRDRWMFAAGRASGAATRRNWIMPTAAVVLGLSAFALGTQYSRHAGASPAVEIAAPLPFAPDERSSVTESPSPASHLELRRNFDDLDSFIADSATPMQADPTSRQELFRELIN